MTSTRCPTLLTCSLQLIVVTPRRGGGGHWRWTESQREGRCLRPGMLSCRWVSYHCGGRSALILYFLAFQNFPHQIIVMFCLISQYHCQALQKNAYFRTKTHLPHWKIRKIEILIWAKFIKYVIIVIYRLFYLNGFGFNISNNSQYWWQ